MSYKVVWSPSALDQLTTCWMAANDQDAVSLVPLRIDQILEENPAVAGESREMSVRIEDPLVTYFEVEEPTSTVFISLVGLSRRNE